MAWTLAMLLLLLIVLFVLVGYLVWLNRALARQPTEALRHSPTRWTSAEVLRAADEYASRPPDLASSLPPRTGNRYIVVGGAGFTGGWVVEHLLLRGEHPRRIRVLDLLPPMRDDMLQAQANGVEFLQVDISQKVAVDDAFSRPWYDGQDKPLTVFHMASNIRFFERHEKQWRASERVNVQGTHHILDAARAAGTRVLVYTSSGSIAIRPPRFWLWPWERKPTDFVQTFDDTTKVPNLRADSWCNYSHSKALGERLVLQADNVAHDKGRAVLRTAALRPGNGIFGPRGDLLIGLTLVRKFNPTWLTPTIQSFCYVENVALAHLQLERTLIDMPEVVGGESYTICDDNPPVSYGDMDVAANVLTNGETTFLQLPPALLLLLAHLIELYVHARLKSPRILGRLLPQLSGEIVNLQPSVFSLTLTHLIFDASRAMRDFGYRPAYTTIEGVCKTVAEFKASGKKVEYRQTQLGAVTG